MRTVLLRAALAVPLLIVFCLTSLLPQAYEDVATGFIFGLFAWLIAFTLIEDEL